MQILIAGGSGFLGRALETRLRSDGHTVRVLTRTPRAGRPDDVGWTPDGGAGAWARTADAMDAVINLAGEGIADRRWTAERKQALRNSRVLATRSLVAAIRQASRPPSVFVSGSGIDYYAPTGAELVTEATAPGSDFLARLCIEWEQEAEQASAVTRVALIRTSPVLHPRGGVLAKMLLPFRLGIGGPLGSGAQYFPWIHIDDWVGIVVWLIEEANARGAFNATAPSPTTNAEFTRALGHALARPAFMPVPRFALRLAVGELADTVLTSRRAIPARAHEMGFTFRYGEIHAALNHLLH